VGREGKKFWEVRVEDRVVWLLKNGKKVRI
jgi:hypothetical protein